MLSLENGPFNKVSFNRIATNIADVRSNLGSDRTLLLEPDPDWGREDANIAVWQIGEDVLGVGKKILVGVAIHPDISPFAAICSSSGKLLVGYDEFLRIVDLNNFVEQELIQGRGHIVCVRPVKEGALVTFDGSISILDKNAAIIWEFCSPLDDRIISGGVPENGKLVVQVEDFSFVTLDVDDQSLRSAKARTVPVQGA